MATTASPARLLSMSGDAGLQQLSEGIREEMMVAMLSAMQGTANTCADICIQHLTSLHEQMLRELAEVKAELQSTGFKDVVEQCATEMSPNNKDKDRKATELAGYDFDPSDGGAALEAMYDDLDLMDTAELQSKEPTAGVGVDLNNLADALSFNLATPAFPMQQLSAGMVHVLETMEERLQFAASLGGKRVLHVKGFGQSFTQPNEEQQGLESKQTKEAVLAIENFAPEFLVVDGDPWGSGFQKYMKHYLDQQKLHGQVPVLIWAKNVQLVGDECRLIDQGERDKRLQQSEEWSAQGFPVIVYWVDQAILNFKIDELFGEGFVQANQSAKYNVRGLVKVLSDPRLSWVPGMHDSVRGCISVIESAERGENQYFQKCSFENSAKGNLIFDLLHNHALEAHGVVCCGGGESVLLELATRYLNKDSESLCHDFAVLPFSRGKDGEDPKLPRHVGTAFGADLDAPAEPLVAARPDEVTSDSATAQQLSADDAASHLPAAPTAGEVATVRRLPNVAGGACVVTGPSGVGKSTMIKRLMADFPGKFGFSISHTTRDPRDGEQNGVDYHFVSKEQMEKDIQAGLFIEHAEVHGNFYGTAIAAVESVMNQGLVCLLDIDVQGADSVRKSSLACCTFFVFFAPPSMEVLEQRLRGRGTETEEKVQKRLAGAVKEIAVYEAKPEAWDLTLKFTNPQGDLAYAEFRRCLERKLQPQQQDITQSDQYTKSELLACRDQGDAADHGAQLPSTTDQGMYTKSELLACRDQGGVGEHDAQLPQTKDQGMYTKSELLTFRDQGDAVDRSVQLPYAKADENSMTDEKSPEEKRLAADAAQKAEGDGLAAEAAQQAEVERLAAEKKTEEERLAAEAARKAEEDRLAAEAAQQAESDRVAAEKKAEEERLSVEAARKAEEDRLAAEAAQQVEVERIAAEKKADEERLAAEAKDAPADDWDFDDWGDKPAAPSAPAVSPENSANLAKATESSEALPGKESAVNAGDITPAAAADPLADAFDVDFEVEATAKSVAQEATADAAVVTPSTAIDDLAGALDVDFPEDPTAKSAAQEPMASAAVATPSVAVDPLADALDVSFPEDPTANAAALEPAPAASAAIATPSAAADPLADAFDVDLNIEATANSVVQDATGSTAVVTPSAALDDLAGALDFDLPQDLTANTASQEPMASAVVATPSVAVDALADAFDVDFAEGPTASTGTQELATTSIASDTTKKKDVPADAWDFDWEDEPDTTLPAVPAVNMVGDTNIVQPVVTSSTLPEGEATPAAIINTAAQEPTASAAVATPSAAADALADAFDVDFEPEATAKSVAKEATGNAAGAAPSSAADALADAFDVNFEPEATAKSVAQEGAASAAAVTPSAAVDALADAFDVDFEPEATAKSVAQQATASAAAVTPSPAVDNLADAFDVDFELEATKNSLAEEATGNADAVTASPAVDNLADAFDVDFPEEPVANTAVQEPAANAAVATSSAAIDTVDLPQESVAEAVVSTPSTAVDALPDAFHIDLTQDLTPKNDIVTAPRVEAKDAVADAWDFDDWADEPDTTTQPALAAPVVQSTVVEKPPETSEKVPVQEQALPATPVNLTVDPPVAVAASSAAAASADSLWDDLDIDFGEPAAPAAAQPAAPAAAQSAASAAAQPAQSSIVVEDPFAEFSIPDLTAAPLASSPSSAKQQAASAPAPAKSKADDFDPFADFEI